MSDQLTMSVGPVVWVGPYPKGGTHQPGPTRRPSGQPPEPPKSTPVGPAHPGPT